MTVIAHRCAVLGKPIAHSLSPVLHNAAYKALGLDDWAYERHEVGESDLDGFLKGLDPTWRGLSLTMPLKKTIQPYGTPSNMWAQRLKVANTAIFDWPAEPGITPVPPPTAPPQRARCRRSASTTPTSWASCSPSTMSSRPSGSLTVGRAQPPPPSSATATPQRRR